MARKKKKHEELNHERWLISYADFITLMFAFFTVMYAISNTDDKKSEKFEQSIQKAFGVLVGPGKDISGKDFPEFNIDGSVIEPPIKVFYRMDATPQEVKEAVMRMIREKLSQEDMYKAGLKVIAESDGVRVSFLTEKLFASGSANIRDSALNSLDVVGHILKICGRKIKVEGHTDNVPIKSPKYPSNWELAGARAAAIVRYLISAHDVGADRLAAISFADQRPRVNNVTLANRMYNRRVEILITTK